MNRYSPFSLVLLVFLLQFIAPNSALSPPQTDTLFGGLTSSLNDSSDVCMSCVNFLSRDLQIIIDIIAKVGVIVSCQDVCSPLNNSVDVDLCMSLCNIVGIDTFWKIFERADIDPIFACQLMTACIIPRYPAAKFLSVSAIPSNVPPGAMIDIGLQFQVYNATGAGQFAYVVYFPQGNTKFIYDQLFSGYSPGIYNLSFDFQTFANSSFPVGQYPVYSSICAGMCDGRSPYSQDLADTETSFILSALGPLH